LSDLKNLKDEGGLSIQGKSGHLSGVYMKYMFYETFSP